MVLNGPTYNYESQLFLSDKTLLHMYWYMAAPTVMMEKVIKRALATDMRCIYLWIIIYFQAQSKTKLQLWLWAELAIILFNLPIHPDKYKGDSMKQNVEKTIFLTISVDPSHPNQNNKSLKEACVSFSTYQRRLRNLF